MTRTRTPDVFEFQVIAEHPDDEAPRLWGMRSALTQEIRETLDEDEALKVAKAAKAAGSMTVTIERRQVLDGAPLKWRPYGE